MQFGIWLLEKLYKLNTAVSHSQVNFLKKQLRVTFNHNNISLKELVRLLTSIGYEPQILLENVEQKKENKASQTLHLRIGVAGFCFLNVMLFSFPEYLGIDVNDYFLKTFFVTLNFILSLPVVFFSGWEYFGSAITGLKKKIINIDFPISLGILALFGRSVHEALSQTGAGYFDSLTGLIFLLLVGKFFQEKTYSYLNFERNYKSFFPLSVTIKQEGKEKSMPINKLMVGNRIIVRKNEIFLLTQFYSMAMEELITALVFMILSFFLLDSKICLVREFAFQNIVDVQLLSMARRPISKTHLPGWGV